MLVRSILHAVSNQEPATRRETSATLSILSPCFVILLTQNLLSPALAIHVQRFSGPGRWYPPVNDREASSASESCEGDQPYLSLSLFSSLHCPLCVPIPFHILRSIHRIAKPVMSIQFLTWSCHHRQLSTFSPPPSTSSQNQHSLSAIRPFHNEQNTTHCATPISIRQVITRTRSKGHGSPRSRISA